MSLSDLSKLIVSSFSFRIFFREMSLFVSLILRDHSGRHCRNLLRYRGRPKYNSHFSKSGFPPSHLTLFFSILTNISCSLNCYLIEITTSSLYYLSLSFESLDHNKYSYFVLFFDFLLLFLLVYFYSFLMIFLFWRSLSR